MSDQAAILDLFVRGIAAGAMAATALGVWRSPVSPQARWVTLAMGLSTIAWLITESSTCAEPLAISPRRIMTAAAN